MKLLVANERIRGQAITNQVFPMSYQETPKQDKAKMKTRLLKAKSGLLIPKPVNFRNHKPFTMLAFAFFDGETIHHPYPYTLQIQLQFGWVGFVKWQTFHPETLIKSCSIDDFLYTLQNR